MAQYSLNHPSRSPTIYVSRMFRTRYNRQPQRCHEEETPSDTSTRWGLRSPRTYQTAGLPGRVLRKPGSKSHPPSFREGCRENPGLRGTPSRNEINTIEALVDNERDHIIYECSSLLSCSSSFTVAAAGPSSLVAPPNRGFSQRRRAHRCATIYTIDFP